MNRESETGGPLAGVRREVAEQPEVCSGTDSGMDVVEALRVLAEVRTDRQVVISNQMSARLWPALSQHPLDFNYLSSTMGGAIPLGLGLALARPDLEVIVLSGDGSLLMNLGCLVTVVGSGATNLTVILLDNGIYEVTGGQRTPGRLAPVNYSQLALATGFSSVLQLDTLEAWKNRAECCWRLSGPRFFALRVQPIPAEVPRVTTTDVRAELRRLGGVLHNSGVKSCAESQNVG